MKQPSVQNLWYTVAVVIAITTTISASVVSQTGNYRGDYLNPESQNLKHSEKIRTKRQAYQTSTDDAVVFAEENEPSAPWERPMAPARPKETPLSRFNQSERDCFSMKKVMHEGKCETLGLDGPCDKNHILVMENYRPDQPEWNLQLPMKTTCVRKPCTNRNDVYWPTARRCIDKSRAKAAFCTGPGNWEISYDIFGSGICSCPSEYGIYEENNGCYEFYQQEPCEEGQVFTFDVNTRTTTCSADLCLKENSHEEALRKKRSAERTYGSDFHHVTHYGDTALGKSVNFSDANVLSIEGSMPTLVNENYGPRYSSLSSSRRNLLKNRLRRQADNKMYAPMDGNGPCYKIGDRTICEADKQGEYYFGLNERTHIPMCLLSNLELHLIDAVPRCRVDDRNQCKNEVVITQEDELAFLLDLKNQLKRKRDTKGRPGR